jgi:hypothetical protein
MEDLSGNRTPLCLRIITPAYIRNLESSINTEEKERYEAALEILQSLLRTQPKRDANGFCGS